jgi:hypothetical protein
VEEKRNFTDIKQNTVQYSAGSALSSLLLLFSGGNSKEHFTVSIQNRASSCNFLEARFLLNNLSDASPQICTENHKVHNRFIQRTKIKRPVSPIQHVSSHSGMLHYKACQMITSHCMTHQHGSQHKQPHPPTPQFVSVLLRLGISCRSNSPPENLPVKHLRSEVLRQVDINHSTILAELESRSHFTTAPSASV